MLEKPSCSGLNVERDSERVQTALPPTKNSMYNNINTINIFFVPYCSLVLVNTSDAAHVAFDV